MRFYSGQQTNPYETPQTGSRTKSSLNARVSPSPRLVYSVLLTYPALLWCSFLFAPNYVIAVLVITLLAQAIGFLLYRWESWTTVLIAQLVVLGCLVGQFCLFVLACLVHALVFHPLDLVP